jgi:heptosyltransferase II
MNCCAQDSSASVESLQPRRLLVRLPNWVGDLVMAIPTVQALRRLYPNTLMTALAHPRVVDLVPEDLFDACITCGAGGRLQSLWKTARRIRSTHSDTAIIFPDSFSSALACMLGGVPQRLGYKADGRRMLLQHTLPLDTTQQHRSDKYLALLSLLTQQRMLENTTPGLQSTSVGRAEIRTLLINWGVPEGSPLLLLAPGSQASSRRWPVERFILLARGLQRHTGGFVGLIGSPAERDLCGDIVSRAGGAALNLAGNVSLSHLVDLCKLSTVVVSNDNGAAHIAAASGTPTCVLFGAGDARITGPRGAQVTIVNRQVHCSPCVSNTCQYQLECLTAITVEEVLMVVRDACLSQSIEWKASEENIEL